MMAVTVKEPPNMKPVVSVRDKDGKTYLTVTMSMEWIMWFISVQKDLIALDARVTALEP